MPTHYITNPQTGERKMLVNNQWVTATPASTSSVMRPVTEAQAKDGFNAKRMVESAAVLNQLEGQGFDRGLATLEPGWLPGHDSKRKYDSAADAWSDALLRLTSGANAPQPEIEKQSKTYFPHFGDSEAVRKQKTEMRAAAERDALARAGPAAMGVSGTAPQRPEGASGGPPNPRARPGGNRPVPSQAPGWRIVGVE